VATVGQSWAGQHLELQSLLTNAWRQAGMLSNCDINFAHSLRTGRRQPALPERVHDACVPSLVHTVDTRSDVSE
jgi:hypothetical protein